MCILFVKKDILTLLTKLWFWLNFEKTPHHLYIQTIYSPLMLILLISHCLMYVFCMKYIMLIKDDFKRSFSYHLRLWSNGAHVLGDSRTNSKSVSSIQILLMTEDIIQIGNVDASFILGFIRFGSISTLNMLEHLVMGKKPCVRFRAGFY